jgi:hypothetical protein
VSLTLFTSGLPGMGDNTSIYYLPFASEFLIFVAKNVLIISWAPVSHTCNLSYLEASIRKIVVRSQPGKIVP